MPNIEGDSLQPPEERSAQDPGLRLPAREPQVAALGAAVTLPDEILPAKFHLEGVAAVSSEGQHKRRQSCASVARDRVEADLSAEAIAWWRALCAKGLSNLDNRKGRPYNAVSATVDQGPGALGDN